MNKFKFVVILALAAALPAWTQLIYFPSAASSRLYFPQLADGGAPTQKWATTILLVNGSSTTAASVTLTFYDDGGQPLALDFGSGAKPTLPVTIPAGGATTMTSSGNNASAAIGWGIADSDVPITGTVLYEARRNGTPLWDVAAAGTSPTYLYNTYANASLGIAVANPSSTNTIYLTVFATMQDGTPAGTGTVRLGPNGHSAFGLASVVSGLPSDFVGSLGIKGTTSAVPFVAWAVNSRDGLLSPLPPGNLTSPAPYDRTVADVVARMRLGGAAALQDMTALLGSQTASMATVISNLQYSIDESATISASYNTTDKKVHVSSAMVQALGDSRAAMGFLSAHLATLAVQQQVGVDPRLVSALGGLPLMADTVGMIALMKTGMDPMGATDFYGRMQYAMIYGTRVDSNLITEFGLTNVQARLTALNQEIQAGCSMVAALSADCEASHLMWNPDVAAPGQ